MESAECVAVEYKPTIKDKIKCKLDSVKVFLKNKSINASLKIIRWSTRDCNYKKHAQREFDILGWPGDDEMQGWVCENIIDLLSVFSSQGHSGSSAPYVLNIFEKVSSFKPITPIECTDLEWGESFSNDDSYQNKRLSSVFKKGKDGKPYYLDAITWRTQTGSTWHGSALKTNGEKVTSSQLIKLPFTPKTFYIDVIEKEIEKDDWEFYIKDESQLDEVFEYYVCADV